MNDLVLNDPLNVIMERKSVRCFTGDPVSKMDIDILLHAAMAAPAAMYALPWKFIVITDKEKLKQIAGKLPYAKMLPDAGTAIIVCAVPEDAAFGSDIFAVLDCACASQNILLAAEALQLGAVWTAVYPDKKLMEIVREEFHIPEIVIPLNIIPIGHPTGIEKAQYKYQAENIHWENW